MIAIYLVPLKAQIVDALQQTFNSDFVPTDFHRVNVSMEYPLTKQAYPSIWINYDDQDSLTIAGIDHKEFVYDNPSDPGSPVHEVTRWLFAGEVTLTVAALSSLERDNLYDQLVRIFAFSRMEQADVDFRNLLEANEFVAMIVNWDELHPRGEGAAPGTPWGTSDEVIYEKSVAFDIEGEFISDPATNTLVRLGSITVQGTDEDQPENPAFTLGIPRSD